MLYRHQRCIMIFFQEEKKYYSFGDDWYKPNGRKILHAYILNVNFIYYL